MLSDKVFDKTIKPTSFTYDGQKTSVNNNTWTDLVKIFVKWLIENGHLKRDNLPIHSHAKRGKYFINSAGSHCDPEKDGAWHEVDGFWIDTKYNAEHHIKNIMSTLEQLDIFNPDIKISFHKS